MTSIQVFCLEDSWSFLSATLTGAKIAVGESKPQIWGVLGGISYEDIVSKLSPSKCQIVVSWWWRSVAKCERRLSEIVHTSSVLALDETTCIPRAVLLFSCQELALWGSRVEPCYIVVTRRGWHRWRCRLEFSICMVWCGGCTTEVVVPKPNTTLLEETIPWSCIYRSEAEDWGDGLMFCTFTVLVHYCGSFFSRYW